MKHPTVISGWNPKTCLVKNNYRILGEAHGFNSDWDHICIQWKKGMSVKGENMQSFLSLNHECLGLKSLGGLYSVSTVPQTTESLIAAKLVHNK